MIQVEIEANPNCAGSDQFFFTELDAPRTIRAIRVLEKGGEIECDVAGVDKAGRFVEAHGVKVADSGSGFAFLIQGGAWGIRIRPRRYETEAWDLKNPHQWGEAFKIYSEEDIIWKAQNPTS